MTSMTFTYLHISMHYRGPSVYGFPSRIHDNIYLPLHLIHLHSIPTTVEIKVVCLFFIVAGTPSHNNNKTDNYIEFLGCKHRGVIHVF